MFTHRFILGSFVGVLFLGCGGAGNAPAAAPSAEFAAPDAAPPPAVPSAPTATTPAPDAGAAPAIAETAPSGGAAAINWDAMTHEQKLEHMKKVVLPKMKAVFQAQDPKKWANVSCGTCHGDGAKNGTFAMPNPKLPVLTAADNFKKHMQKDPEMTKFMIEKVKPEMAATIGEKPMDASGKGFGCGDCHTFAK